MHRTLLTMLLAASFALGQSSVPPEFQGHRIWATVPVIGTGKPGDPFRAMFTQGPPSTPRGQARVERKFDPKIDFTSVQVYYSDNGKTALVEFVADHPDAFKEILASKDPRVKVFERGKTTKQDVEAEFRKHKPNFDIDAVTERKANATSK